MDFRTIFRPRTQGAGDVERMQLLNIISHYWEDLEKFDSGGGTLIKKLEVWHKIAAEFNGKASVSVQRTPQQIRTLFKNMKTKAKKYKVTLEQAKLNNPAGCSGLVDSDPVSEIVLQLITTQDKEVLQTLLNSLQNIKFPASESKEDGKHNLAEVFGTLD